MDDVLGGKDRGLAKLVFLPAPGTLTVMGVVRAQTDILAPKRVLIGRYRHQRFHVAARVESASC